MELPDGTVRKLRRPADPDSRVAHELTFTCYHRLKLLDRDRTREWFVRAVTNACRTHQIAVWAWVIMPEHAHLLIVPLPRPHLPPGVCPISDFLKSTKQSVGKRATAFLSEHAPEWLERLRVTWPSGRIEHRFWQQGGGYDRDMRRFTTIWASIEYLHNNPVRRGLAPRAADWIWSSARAYAGEGESPIPLNLDELPRH